MNIMKSMASSYCARFAAFLLIAALVVAVACVNAQTDTPSTAMFVFGDSYADTGNHDETAESWQPPYGETWPGEPAGRFSDGKILTDYIASILNITTPAPYYRMRSTLGCDFVSGINFAYGGSGIFKTYFAPEGPTLSSQIDQFQVILNDCSNIRSLMSSPRSMVLIVIVGNDYITYVQEHQGEGDWQELVGLWKLFIPSVVNGIIDSVNKLYNIGFRKFAIAKLEPIGCIPYFGAANNECDVVLNILSDHHNWLLSDGLEEISSYRDGISIIALNQTESFRNALENYFDNNLEACINYTTNIACPDPKNFFFWDGVHPTHAGWNVVTDMYKDDLLNLINKTNIGQSLTFEA